MSNLVKHAEHELELIRGPREEGAMQDYADAVEQAILDIIKLFSEQGHSGMSAGIVTGTVERLMRFEPLSPLTGEDNEWCEVGPGVFQNKRCSHVFRENGEAYDIDGIVFREPGGACFTNRDSRVPVTFPYVPKTEYRDVPAEAA